MIETRGSLFSVSGGHTIVVQAGQPWQPLYPDSIAEPKHATFYRGDGSIRLWLRIISPSEVEVLDEGRLNSDALREEIQMIWSTWTENGLEYNLTYDQTHTQSTKDRMFYFGLAHGVAPMQPFCVEFGSPSRPPYPISGYPPTDEYDIEFDFTIVDREPWPAEFVAIAWCEAFESTFDLRVFDLSVHPTTDAPR